MTDQDKIFTINILLEKLNLNLNHLDLSRDVYFCDKLKEISYQELEDTIWTLYCFADDIADIINS